MGPLPAFGLQTEGRTDSGQGHPRTPSNGFRHFISAESHLASRQPAEKLISLLYMRHNTENHDNPMVKGPRPTASVIVSEVYEHITLGTDRKASGGVN